MTLKMSSGPLYRPMDDTDAEKNTSYVVPRRATMNSSKRTNRKFLKLIFSVFIVVGTIYLIIVTISKDDSWDSNIDADVRSSRQTTNGYASTKVASNKIYEAFLKNNINLSSYRYINESVVTCSEEMTDSRLYIRNRNINEYTDLKVIYFVTPTYPRPEQVSELTRLAHTLMHVPKIHWIIADDRPGCNPYLEQVLNKFEIPYTLLSSPMPAGFRKQTLKPRGVSNRRSAIQWIRKNKIVEGILYFGDDDNTYDLKLFSEIRSTNRVSMFPVGLIPAYSVSGPVVKNEKVIAFLDSWVSKRQWPVDMASFAVNLEYFSQFPNATMPYKAGYEEDYFLRSIGLRMDMIEPKANNCTEILVWHTQTKLNPLKTLKIKRAYLDDRSNLGTLFENLKLLRMAEASETEGQEAILSKNGKIRSFDYFFS